jgi:glucoamylase
VDLSSPHPARAGRTLRLIVQAPATAHWTNDDWATQVQTDTAPAELGNLHFLDLPTERLRSGGKIEWTFFWPEASRWEGGDNFRAEIA